MSVNDGLARSLRAGTISEAQAALYRAEALFRPALAARATGTTIQRAKPHDATLILRDLLVRRNQLTGAERTRANQIFARPVDGGEFYTPADWTGPEAANSPVCNPNLCVHWTTTGADAPSPVDANANGYPDWVDQTLTIAQEAWNVEVDTLGYRAPRDDSASATNGGDGRSDIYISDIDADGLLGYCTTDDPALNPAGGVWYASGYCVYDNNYSHQPGDPLNTLRATSAHEFFHAVQFGYDIGEDAWLMEGTATWVEDVVHDSVNFPVPYLGDSQWRNPFASLDSTAGLKEYGAWGFFQFLTEYLSSTAAPDNTVISDIWSLADSTPGAPDYYSMQAVKAVSSSSSRPFREVYADFAMVNRYPKWYAEGSTYPAPAKAATFTLGPNRRSTGWLTTKLNHLTNAPATIVHTRTVGRRARLTVTFDLPDLRYGSAARVLVRRADGTVRLLRIQPNSKGYGVITVGFGRGIVNSVTVIAVNGSTRYSCWQGTNFACNGIPLDQGRRVWFRARLR